MKIAYLLHNFPKLSESFVLNEIVELIRRGHDVQIYSLYDLKESIVHEEIQKYDILNRTHYMSPINTADYFRISKNFLILSYQNLRQLKISKIEFKNNIKIACFATDINKRKMDLIHTHFATMGPLAETLSKLTGLPYTLTAHAYDIYMNPNVKQLKHTMENAESVITISEYNKKYMRELGVTNNIEVVRCGLNLDKFNLINNKRRTINKDGNIKILTTARLVEKKGIEYLIKAVPLVTEEIKNCKFTIIGGGPLEGILHNLSAELGVDRYIDFKGNVSDSELIQYYQNSDIFILPCVVTENGDCDGIPVAMMEAMAVGLPVISTNVSGIPELVEDGVSGILVQPKDDKAIADAIVALCSDRELRVRMGELGRKIIERKFNITFEAEKLIGVFNKIR